MLNYTVHPVGSTGVAGRKYIANASQFSKAMVEFQVEVIGATPTVTFSIEGLTPGTDPAVAANWNTLAVVQSDSTVAASNAAIVLTTVGFARRFVDGLDKRAFDAYSVNVTANTNVTFSARLALA